jgi:hypothetical protein
MHEIQAQITLNPTKVGKSFLFDAHIKVKLVIRVKKYSHQMEMPKIKPGTMITALGGNLTMSRGPLPWFSGHRVS